MHKNTMSNSRESLLKINFININHTLIKDVLKIKVSLFKIDPYTHGNILQLGLPFKLGNKNLFLGIKGYKNKCFLSIVNLTVQSNFKVYFKTLFNYEKENIKMKIKIKN